MATFILNIPVPGSGDGVAVNVSDLAGEKTVTLSGTFEGQYVLLGSHDGNHFDPVLSFDAGGIEGIKQTFSGALKWVRLRSQAMKAHGVTANISGLSIPGNNTFGIFPTLMPGASGPQASSDLGLIDYQGDVNFMGQGGVRGSVVVEGSFDNQEFNPIGAFSAEPASSSLLGAQSFEFSPLSTGDRIRYVRLNVRGTILSPFTVTFGGAQTATGGGASETLHDTYEMGTIWADQTINLLDSLGGTVVFDATDPGFSGLDAVKVLVGGGEGAGFLRTGGMVLGPANIVIGIPGQIPVLSAGSTYSVAIGTDNMMVDGSLSTALGATQQITGINSNALGTSDRVIGNNATAVGTLCDSVADYACAVGYNANANEVSSLAVGSNCFSQGDGSISIGSGVTASGVGEIVIGQDSYTLGALGFNLVIGNSALCQGQTGVAIGQNAMTGLSSVESIAIGAYSYAADNFQMGSSLAIGGGAIADSNSVSLGNNAICNTGYNNVAIGPSALNSGQDSIAIGAATVTGTFSVVIGHGAMSAGLFPPDSTVVLGDSAFCSGSEGVAIGYFATLNSSGIAIGTTVAGDPQGADIYPISIGGEAIYGDWCIGIGVGSKTVGITNVALGFQAFAGLGNLISISGSFASAADSAFNHGVQTTFTSTGALPPELMDGQPIIISNTVDYNGTWTVLNVTANTFDIVMAFVGDESGDWSVDTIVKGLDNVAIGTEADTGSGGLSLTSYDGNVAVGFQVKVFGTAGVAMGYLAHIGLQSTSAVPLVSCVALGDNANVHADAGIAVGLDAEVDGEDGIAIGAESLSGSGLQNTCVGFTAQVQGSGDYNLCLGDFASIQNDSSYVTVIGHGATAQAGSTVAAVVIGSGAGTAGDATTVVGAGATATLEGWSVALGAGAAAMGLSAIAIGTDAQAGANETVFDMTFAHIQTFRAVSNEPGAVLGTVLDLFQFAQALLGSNSDINKTDMALLIRDANNNISLKPVYLSDPSLLGGVSTLLVANP
jgi:hypothetical protein